MDNKEKNFESQDEQNVENYRRQRVNEFKLNIKKDEEISSNGAPSQSKEKKPDFTDEITSFSDENTKAQIERASKKELRRQNREEKKIQKVKSGRNKKVYSFMWLVFIIIASVIAGEFLIDGSRDFLAMNREDESIAIIRITKGDDFDSVAKQLEVQGVIDSSYYFTMFATVTGRTDNIEPGIYQIPRNKDYLGIVNYLQNSTNRDNTITLRIPEGSNILEISELLYDSGVTYNKELFLELCNSDTFDKDYTFLKNIDAPEDRLYKLEGYLFPDTYEFYIDEAPDVTIKRFLDNFRSKVYESEYDLEGYSDPITLIDAINNEGYTLDEFVILASLIQAEAADTEDMYNVSSVIHNRLRYGAQNDIHSLGLDSTEFYPYRSKADAPADFHSMYETYDTKGLPPGAICCAGYEALLASVSPAETDYLYFCHGQNGDGTVTAYYAETFEEHQENISKAGLD